MWEIVSFMLFINEHNGYPLKKIISAETKIVYDRETS